ncbi:hypothetical protein POTOM_052961 [Populus tomentosa]|uniref:Mitochondrial import inner membrane translocase subunit TIM50 n=1 Tax=Populus tomentosa TaxID=118781 RepID=A0A8X8C7U2_POPTO|nr:hypothetical protein POTOM_052961 [Populus tomentosa]
MVVLDLDETLACAYETSSLPPIIRTRAEEAGVKCFELECFSSEKDVEGKPEINHVTMFERPGLKEFLKQIGEFADLILFTAGIEGYASPLFDRIDVENRFSQRLFRPSTVSTVGLLTKFPFENPISLGLLRNDLFSSFSLSFGISCVRERERRGIVPGSVLVASHRFDWQNGVFSKVCAVTLLVTETSRNLGLDEMDCKFVLFLLLFIERFIEPWAARELSFWYTLELGMRILSDSRARSEMPLERDGISRTCEGSVVFIKNPSLQKDVRPVLHKRFHMLEWFQMHGIPASALIV